MEGCPGCQSRLLSRDEARRLLVSPDQAGDAGRLWRRFSEEAARAASVPETRPAAGSLLWRCASVAVMTAAVALGGFWLLREAGGPAFEADGVLPDGRFEIEYVRVGGAPAQTFVFQPQGTDTVFVWASRTP